MEQLKTKHENFKRSIGSRILTEANDLKRTLKTVAREIQIDEGKLNRIVQGDCEIQESYEVIEKMGDLYPIDKENLYLLEDDCHHGAKIMRVEESKATARQYLREDRNGDRTPYYEYRDTAMTRISPYKPEYIEELRMVDNADPHNPDVVFNKGHFMHQYTFFVGPVNYYWELNGKRYCEEMNTGDSVYGTPWWPHTFANRDSSQLAYIVAVTFGGDVSRAQKEMYAIGRRLEKYQLDYRKAGRATTQLIRQHMSNENMTEEILRQKAQAKGMSLDLDLLFDESREKSFEDLETVAQLLEIEISDIWMPPYRIEDEVKLRFMSESDSYVFPSEAAALYKIYPLARTSKMPLMKGFNCHVLTDKLNLDHPMETSLHTYLYNYGAAPVAVSWQDGNETCEDVLHQGDSMFMQPFIQHAFANEGNEQGQLCIFRVSGAINLSAQRELSYFSEIDRVIEETGCWFD